MGFARLFERRIIGRLALKTHRLGLKRGELLNRLLLGVLLFEGGWRRLEGGLQLVNARANRREDLRVVRRRGGGVRRRRWGGNNRRVRDDAWGRDGRVCCGRLTGDAVGVGERPRDEGGDGSAGCRDVDTFSEFLILRHGSVPKSRLKMCARLADAQRAY